jgi:RNA polymerase sigma-70 factor (ECF subfamily)
VSVRPADRSPTPTGRAETGDGAAPADEASLVLGLRHGDVGALALAFDRWHQRVRVLARRLLSDAAAAEDLVQDVFEALPSAARRYRGEVDLQTFLFGITVNRARRHHRAAARRLRALFRLASERPAGSGDPERDVYSRELGVRLGAALDRLPLAQRVAFVLCEVEELTSLQAAAIADVPEATIRTRLFHARRRLREWLTDEHHET